LDSELAFFSFIYIESKLEIFSMKPKLSDIPEN